LLPYVNDFNGQADASGVYPVGVTTVTYCALDANGNDICCSFTVTVVDPVEPLITCPNNIVRSLDAGACDSFFINIPLPTLNEACFDSIPPTLMLSSGRVPLNIAPQTGLTRLGVTNFSIGNAPVTTVSDVIITGVWNSDNGSSNERPTFSIEGNNLGLLPSGGNAFTFTIPIAVYNQVAVDGILDFTVGADNSVGSFCSTDYIDINFAVQAGTELLPYINDFNGQADASGVYPVGVTTVTYCALDANGNNICCNFTVTVLDNIVPIITCPADQLENCDTTCLPLVPPLSLVELPLTEVEFLALGGTITENCAIYSLTYIDTETGICPSVVTRTFTVSDNSGNTNSCVQTINVFDNTSPVFLCPPTIFENFDIANHPPYPNIGAFLTAGGVATDTFSFSLVSEVTDGATCPETIARVYSVSDECGNVSTCEQLLLFTDPAHLVITCPNDVVSTLDSVVGGCDSNFVDIPLPTLNDACFDSLPQILTLSSGQVPLNIFPQTGSPTLEVTNFSISGAPSNAIADVIITGVWNSDNGNSVERPTFSIEGNLLGLLPSGGGDCRENALTFTIPIAIYHIVAADGVLDFTVGANSSVNSFCSTDYIDINLDIRTAFLPYVNDFNGQADASGLYPVGVTTVTYCALDGMGNDVCCSFTVTVLDPVAPLITCPDNFIKNCDTLCPSLDPPLSLVDTPLTEAEFLALGGTITENCSIASLTYFDTEIGICPRVVTRTFTVTDTGGNTSTCEQTITVFDNAPPEMICPPTIIENFDIANHPPYQNVAAFLAAGGITSDTFSFSLVNEVTDGATCPETITRVYTVSDACGNISACEQLLVFTDPTPLVISCPSDIVINNFSGDCDSFFINVPLPTLNDACFDSIPPIITLSSGQVPLNIAPQSGLSTLGETDFSISGAPSTTIADVILTGVWNSDNDNLFVRPTFTLEGNLLGFLPGGGGACMENAFTFTIPIAVYNQVATNGVLNFTVGADGDVNSFCSADYIDINLEVVSGTELLPYRNDFNGQADASGIYPIGVTTVNYCALDGFGNEVCCDFTVTVLDPPPLEITCPNDMILSVSPDTCENNVFIEIPLLTINNGCIDSIPPIINLSSGQVPLNIAPQTGLSTLGETNFTIDNAYPNTVEDVILTGVWNSDNRFFSDRPTFSLEGNLLGLLPSGGVACTEKAFIFTIPISVYNQAAADGVLDFNVGADGDVNSFCSTDYIDINLMVTTGTDLLPYRNDFNGQADASGLYPIGITTVNYCALDRFGNEVCCSFTVTVLDPPPLEITCPNDIVLPVSPDTCENNVFVDIPLPMLNGACVDSIPPIINLSSGQVPLNIAPQTGLPSLGETNFTITNAYANTIADVTLTGVWNSDNRFSSERPTFTLEGNLLGLLPSGGGACVENPFTFIIPMAVYNQVAADGVLDFTVGANGNVNNFCSIDYIDINLAVPTGTDLLPYINDFNGQADASGIYPIGVTTVNYCALDRFGNEVCCSFTVTVLDPPPLEITCPNDIVIPLSVGACVSEFVNIPLPTLNNSCIDSIPPIINLSSGQIPLNIAPQTGLPTLGETKFTITNAYATAVADVILTGVWNSDNRFSNERPTFSLEGNLLGLLPSGGLACSENAFTFIIPVAVYNQVAADGVLDFTVGADGNVNSFCSTDYIDINLEVMTGTELLPYINDFNGQADASGIYPIGVTSVNFCALDRFGNEVCCSFTVTVLDPLPLEITCPDDIVMPLSTGACGSEFVNIPLPTLNGACVDSVPFIVNLSSGPVPLNIAPQTGFSTLRETNFTISNAPTSTITDVTITGVWNSDNGSSSERPTFSLEGNLLGLLPSGGGDCTENAFTFIIPIAVYNLVTIDGALDFTVGADGSVNSFCSTDYIDINLVVESGTELIPFSNDFNGQADASGFYPLGVTPVTYCAFDVFGNEICCSFTVTVLDTMAPMIACPDDLTVNCDSSTCSLLVPPLSLVDSMLTETEFLSFGGSINENCGIVSVTYMDSEVGVCPIVVSRTFTVTDTSGNSNTCQQTIQVIDNIPPEIICPPTIVGNFAIASQPPYPNFAAFRAAGGMASDTLSFSLVSEVSDGSSCPETITRVYSVSDVCGNVSTCNHFLIFTDPTPPVITCPPNMTVECGDPTDPMTTGIATADAFCGSVMITSLDSFIVDCGLTGTIERTWIATDSIGNISECVQTIIIEDTTPPVFDFCPVDMTVDCGQPTDTMTLGNARAIDICPNMMMGMLPSTFDSNNGFAGNMFDLRNVSPYPVLITSFDGNIEGNAGQSATFEIYYRSGTYVGFESNPADWTSMGTATTITAGGDLPTPVPIGGLTLLPGQTYGIYFVLSSFQNSAALRYTDGNNTFNDGILELTAGIGKGDPDFIGNTFLSRTWNGNIHYQLEAPEFTSPTFEEVSTQGVGCNEFNYTINRTWTAIDNCGNSSTCSQVITVEDNNFPMIDCPADITIECDQSIDPIVTGNGTATGVDCSGESNIIITFSDADTQAPTDCGNDNYIITRTWIATLPCGNASTCNQIITVEDTTPPAITCPQDIIVECDEDTSPQNTGMAMGIDNCSAEDKVVITYSDVSNQDIIGCTQYSFSISRTWMVTDACGNTSTCVQTINVEDSTPPVISCPIDFTVECDEDTSPVNTGMATGMDNCSAEDEIVIIFTDVSNQGSNDCTQYMFTITRTWSATDACGNVATCVQNISVEDTTAPTISCPEDITIACTESTLPINTGMATSVDNCSDEDDITITSSDVSTQEEEGCGQFTFEITRVWTATDVCGNSSICTQTIISVDTVSPIITCPPNVTLPCNSTLSEAARLPNEFISLGGAISDNCTSKLSDFTVTHVDFPADPNRLNTCPGSAEEDRTITRTYTVTDLCGNTSTCEQSFIYLESMEGPIITSFPSDQTVDCAVNVFPQLGLFTAIGDCSNITYSVSEPLIIGIAGCSGTTFEYTYTATDDCGRFATHVQTYTLANDGPEFICPVDICIIECPADVEMIQMQFDDYASLATVITSCSENSISIDNNFDPSGFISQDCLNPTVAVTGAISYQIVEFTATDACGWNTTCTSLVVITDNDGPVINGNVSFGLANCNDPDLQGDYTDWATSQLNNLSASDACLDEAVNLSYLPLSPNTDCSSGLASTEVSFIATDGCGNTTTISTFYRIIGIGTSSLTSTISYAKEFILLQNRPNPFAQETIIGFQLPEATEASLTIYDIAGRVVWKQTKSYEAGKHHIMMDKADLGATGVFYYQLSTDEYSATKKMIVLE